MISRKSTLLYMDYMEMIAKSDMLIHAFPASLSEKPLETIATLNMALYTVSHSIDSIVRLQMFFFIRIYRFATLPSLLSMRDLARTVSVFVCDCTIITLELHCVFSRQITSVFFMLGHLSSRQGALAPLMHACFTQTSSFPSVAPLCV